MGDENEKNLIGALCALAVSVSSSAFGAEKVNIGAPSWTGAQAIAHLNQEIVTSVLAGKQLWFLETCRDLCCNGRGQWRY